MANGKWTDEQDRLLMAMWRTMRVTEIAISGEFNEFSRNAIIGRVFRLRKKWGSEMVPTKQSGHPLPEQPKKKRRRGRTNNFNVKDPVGFLSACKPTPPNPPPAPEAARRLPLLELGPKDCRFIVTGDTREHLYCAVDASAYADYCGNNCYCSFHQRVMRASGFSR